MLSAPVIQNGIPGGEVQITGGGLNGFDANEAREHRGDPPVRRAAVPDPGDRFGAGRREPVLASRRRGTHTLGSMSDVEGDSATDLWIKRKRQSDLYVNVKVVVC